MRHKILIFLGILAGVSIYYWPEQEQEEVVLDNRGVMVGATAGVITGGIASGIYLLRKHYSRSPYTHIYKSLDFETY